MYARLLELWGATWIGEKLAGAKRRGAEFTPIEKLTAVDEAIQLIAAATRESLFKYSRIADFEYLIEM